MHRKNRQSGAATEGRRDLGIVAVTCIVCVLAWLPARAWAGAWTQKAGGMYNRLAVNYAILNEQFDRDGRRGAVPNNGEFTEWNVTYYGERGLTDRLTLVGSLPVKFLQDRSETPSGTRTLRSNGVGDLDLGVRYRLRAEPAVVSLFLFGKLPWLYDKNRTPALGDGQHDAEARVLVGRSLYPYGYGGIEAGYRYRDKAPSDEYRYLVEYGVGVSRHVYARTKLDGILSARNADRDTALATGGNPTLSPEFDLGKLEVTLGYLTGGRWSSEFTYTGVLYGKNTGAGSALQLAAVYSF